MEHSIEDVVAIVTHWAEWNTDVPLIVVEWAAVVHSSTIFYATMNVFEWNVVVRPYRECVPLSILYVPLYILGVPSSQLRPGITRAALWKHS